MSSCNVCIADPLKKSWRVEKKCMEIFIILFRGELFIGINKEFYGVCRPLNHRGINTHPLHQLTDCPMKTIIIESLTPS